MKFNVHIHRTYTEKARMSRLLKSAESNAGSIELHRANISHAVCTFGIERQVTAVDVSIVIRCPFDGGEIAQLGEVGRAI